MFNVQFHEAFPMLFGTELKEHVLVNNCRARHRLRLRRLLAGANGFLLRSDEIGTSEGQGQRNFVIIFWPQYLQFVGFGVVGMTILLFLLFVFFQRRKRMT